MVSGFGQIFSFNCLDNIFWQVWWQFFCDVCQDVKEDYKFECKFVKECENILDIIFILFGEFVVLFFILVVVDVLSYEVNWG